MPATHVARSEYFRHRCSIVIGIGLDIRARVALDAEFLEHVRGPRAGEAHREQHEIGAHLEFAPRNLDHLHRAACVFLPLDPSGDELLDAAVAALESLRGDSPVARHAFLMRRRRAELNRPVGPHERLVFLFGRLRQQLELRHRRRLLSVGRADAV